jgi:hypothetical protein
VPDRRGRSIGPPGRADAHVPRSVVGAPASAAALGPRSRVLGTMTVILLIVSVPASICSCTAASFS